MIQQSKTIKYFYTKESLIQIFLVCAFPLHLWSLLMAFRDFSWVAARTYVWDAIGLVSYALAFALVESLGIFLIVLCLGLLVPTFWGTKKRTALISTFYLIVSFWAILAQLYSANGYALPEWFTAWMWTSGHPARIYWGMLIFLVSLSAALPIWLVIKKDTQTIFENIILLSALYIILDLAAIIIIVIRNFHY